MAFKIIRLGYYWHSAKPNQPAGDAEAWTVSRALSWAAQDLQRRGVTDTARLEAELMLGRALGLDRVRLIIDAARPLTREELGRFREQLLRRRRAEPMAYILGEREFYGLPFRVTQEVLIPRPDTETLVEVALRRTRRRSQFGRYLDVCTGSGCVAIAFGHQRPTWHLGASDISPGAAAVAQFNALKLGVHWNLAVRVGDLLQPFTGQRFDLITANPPYIPDGEIAELQPDIRDHEPHLALQGGREGLDVIQRLVKAARAHLAPGGVLALEVGAGQAARVRRGMEAYGFQEMQVDSDYGGVERVVSGAWHPPGAPA